jgi:iron-sulfur cluster assembly accessory protein
MMDTTVETTQLVTMTESAATIVRNLLAETNIPTYALRIFVAGGGCSGMQYGMAFEPEPRAGDTLIEPFEGVKVVVDPQSVVSPDNLSAFLHLRAALSKTDIPQTG